VFEELVSKMVDRKAIYPKGYKPLSLRKKVLSLVAEANKNTPIERRVIPRNALTVMNRANASLSSLSNESRELGVLREVAKFITAHQDTFKAYEYSSNIDLLPIGHPRSLLNVTASSDIARERYAQWLSSDPSIDNSVRPLIAAAHSLEPGSIQRRHAFTRLRVTLAGAVSSFFKIDDSPIKTLVAAFGFSSGNSSAARRARVALQWRDRYGRWVEMGGGLNFRFKLPNGDIGSAAGNFVGVNADSGYSLFEGKEIVNAGYIEVRGDNTIPDGIYSIESANATPVKARIPKETLKREKISREPSTRKPTAKEATSKDIPTLNDLLKTKVDAPTGWIKQDDGSFISDDDYKLIPNESGFALHRLDKDGNTGNKVGDVESWAEAQSLAEKDSPDYDKFKESVKAKDGKSKAVIPENLPMEGIIEGTDIRYEIKTGPGQLGGRMRDGRIRLRERAAVEGNIAGLYLIGDTSNLELPNLERSEIWRGADGGDRNTIIERPSPPHPFAEDPVAVAKRIVTKLNEANKKSKDATDVPTPDLSAPPNTPSLFKDFDVPNGAFQLRTIDFEPDGRVDEESTDFTDDPERLAVKYTLPQLSVALTQALIGDKDDAIFNEIIESSIGDDDELLDLEETDDVVNSPAPAAGRANGSGAGQLEFNKGDEFVPAEALYNAIFLAGGDPNRVIANAYDAVNGNRNNLNKLHEAAGGTPDPDEEALIDDIFEEISQIKEASTPKEIEEKAANASDEQRDNTPQGELIYNIPVDTEKNPDYYDIDTNPYSPLTEEPDENGYSDNPRYIATKFEEADLLEQFEKAIVNGSGSALLNFNPDAPSNEGLYEVRVEAVRDALQRLNVNTNAVIERILSESNDFEEAPEPAQTPEPARVANMFNENVDAIKDFYDVDDDLFPSGVNVISYLPSDGSLAYVDPWEDLYVARNGSITQVTVSPEWFSDPRGAGQAGWRDLTPQERASIYDTSSEPEEDETETSEPAPVTPQYQYPGPEEAGYSPNNTTIVRGGAVVGKGARVQAIKDGKLGTVTAIQNNPEYLRIKFDDGTTQVRSASKVRAISTDSGGASAVVTREEMLPSTDVQQRLDRPLLPAPRIARSGDTIGVNDESARPDFLEGKTREDSVQSNFSEWKDRDAEVAKAGKDRVSLDVLEQLAYKYSLADQDGSAREVNEIKDEIKRLIGDAYGDRSGISFGGDFYTLKVRDVSIDVDLENSYNNPSKQDMDNGKASVAFGISLDIRDVNGRPIGRAKRSIKIKRKLDRDGNVIEVSKSGYAEFMALYNKELKQKGFGSAYNRWVENWYAANGIEKVYVGAAGGGEYQGGFVWALTGYNWTNSTDVVNIMQKLRRQARTDLENVQLDVLKYRMDRAKLNDGSYNLSILPTPLEFALVGWDPEKDPEKGKWLGKTVMMDTGWSGVKHLNPKAREQIQAINYNQIKNARKRVLSKQNMPSVSSQGLSVIESDEFRNDGVISPYYSQIKDALRNNRSLAVLSVDAKNALNDYVSRQMLNKNRSLSLDDVFRLRDGLSNEYRADHGHSDPFNSANVLSEFTVDDFSAAASGDTSKIAEAGFEVERLNGLGVNDEYGMFQVTHIASGQKFYVKNDEYSSDYSETPAGITELEASIIFRAAGMQGIHDVRAAKNQQNLVVMSEAGSNVPLVSRAVNAGPGTRNGIPDASGTITRLLDDQRFVELLDNPEDIIRMSIFDILSNNVDRHDGNYMIAFDKSTGKLRVFPVDNTLGEIKKDETRIEDFLIDSDSFAGSDAYQNYMPILINKIGTGDLLKIYRHQIKNITDNLSNPLYQPKGFEMDKIIEKWGTYDAFKDAVSSRLNNLISKSSQEYKALENALRLGYWN